MSTERQTIYDWMNKWVAEGQLEVAENEIVIYQAFIDRIKGEREGYRIGQNPDGWQIEMMEIRELLHAAELASLPWKKDKRIQQLIDQCWWMRWNLVKKNVFF